ncbi:hypothetical protein ABGB00_01580 [Staphylococcus saprophyticus]
MNFFYGIENFDVPGYATKKVSNVGDMRNMYKDVFGELNYKSEKFLLMDKMNPHSLLDFMLISDNLKEPKVSITDYTEEEIKYLGILVFEYINYIKQNDIINKYNLENGFFHISFNYDPYTIDRPSGMSKKFFHIHFNYFQNFQISSKVVKKINLNTSNKLHKMMVDKGTILYQYIYYDYYKNSKFEMISKNEINENIPPGIVFKIGDYQNILTKDFFELLNEIHCNLKYLHKFFTNYLFDINIPNNSIFKRLNKKKYVNELIEELDKVSDSSKEILKSFMNQLHDLNYRSEIHFLNSKKLREEHLIFDQLNYSMSIISNHPNTQEIDKKMEKNLYLVVQPKLFSKKGGWTSFYRKNSSC